MSKLTVDITMSADGCIAGPNQTLEQPLGEGCERLHEWLYSSPTASKARSSRRRAGDRR